MSATPSASPALPSAASEAGLPPDVVAALHGQLQEQARAWQARMDEQRARLSDKSAETGDAKGNTFIAGAEGALAAENDDEALALLEHARVQFEAVQAALKRLHDGSYGLCTECGEPIGQARLQAVPQAGHCRQCQSDEEAHRLHHRVAPHH